MKHKYSKLITAIFIVIFLVTIIASGIEYVTGKHNQDSGDKLGAALDTPFWCMLVIPLWIGEIELYLNLKRLLSDARRHRANTIIGWLRAGVATGIIILAICAHAVDDLSVVSVYLAFSLIGIALCVLSRMIYRSIGCFTGAKETEENSDSDILRS